MTRRSRVERQHIWRRPLSPLICDLKPFVVLHLVVEVVAVFVVQYISYNNTSSMESLPSLLQATCSYTSRYDITWNKRFHWSDLFLQTEIGWNQSWSEFFFPRISVAQWCACTSFFSVNVHAWRFAIADNMLCRGRCEIEGDEAWKQKKTWATRSVNRTSQTSAKANLLRNEMGSPLAQDTPYARTFRPKVFPSGKQRQANQTENTTFLVEVTKHHGQAEEKGLLYTPVCTVYAAMMVCSLYAGLMKKVVTGLACWAGRVRWLGGVWLGVGVRRQETEGICWPSRDGK